MLNSLRFAARSPLDTSIRSYTFHFFFFFSFSFFFSSSEERYLRPLWKLLNSTRRGPRVRSSPIRLDTDWNTYSNARLFQHATNRDPFAVSLLDQLCNFSIFTHDRRICGARLGDTVATATYLSAARRKWKSRGATRFVSIPSSRNRAFRFVRNTYESERVSLPRIFCRSIIQLEDHSVASWDFYYRWNSPFVPSLLPVQSFRARPSRKLV